MNPFWLLLLAVGAMLGTSGLFVLLRAVKSGAFEHAEDTKFVLFRDEDDEDDEPPL